MIKNIGRSLMFNRFMKFMYGRYGIDELGKDMLIAAIAVSVIGMIFNLFSLKIVALALNAVNIVLIAFIIYRAFSKNINRRVMENHAYLAKTQKMRTKSKLYRTMFRERKQYRYIKCPGCKNYCRVPKGKGKIKITCRVCAKQFTKKV